jgi:hypothetical protein
MTECTQLSDQMPSVALGSAEWTEEDIRHLTDCESCRAEWELVQSAGGMGEGVGDGCGRAEMAHAVMLRLAAARTKRRRSAWSVAGLATAAGVAALIWSGSGPVHPASPVKAPQVAGLLIPLPELDSLPVAELDSVLQTMDGSGADASGLDTPDVGELNTDELETVLDYWEG